MKNITLIILLAFALQSFGHTPKRKTEPYQYRAMLRHDSIQWSKQNKTKANKHKPVKYWALNKYPF